MPDLQALLDAIDRLPPDEYQQVVEHVRERRKFWVGILPPENIAQLEEIIKPLEEDAAKMTEVEINALIDEAVGEVRRERKAKDRD